MDAHSGGNILYVFSATWNRMGWTKDPTWRLSWTMPLLVQKVSLYAQIMEWRENQGSKINFLAALNA